MPITKHMTIWKLDLTSKEAQEAKQKFNEWLKNLQSENRGDYYEKR